jgi:tetratricopeptide (TPR) repeat protein
VTGFLLALLLLTPRGVSEAESAAEQAVALSATDPGPALTKARRALGQTTEFDPTAFVEAGRKGEIVEDAFRVARRRYRRHRAILYAAVGECLARLGEHLPATRHFRRALVLEPAAARVVRLARSLLAEGRAADALALLRREGDARQATPELVAAVSQAADLLGLPSAQVELDRMRLRGLGAAQPALRADRLVLPAGARLSTGSPFRLEAAAVVLYVAPADCRPCSEDVQTLARALPPDVPRVMVPEDPEQDHALRQVLRVYDHNWPVLLGHGSAAALGLAPGTAVVVARQGWTAAVITPPFAGSLAAVEQALSAVDLTESVPRPKWSGRPPDPLPEPPTPALLPEGLAPGEDPPPSGPFTAGVDAYRAGRYLEALRFFEAAEKKGDGFLLSPEARYNRALCLTRLGRRAEARDTLLAIGDSRFQDDVDKALEGAGARP